MVSEFNTSYLKWQHQRDEAPDENSRTTHAIGWNPQLKHIFRREKKNISTFVSIPSLCLKLYLSFFSAVPPAEAWIVLNSDLAAYGI